MLKEIMRELYFVRLNLLFKEGLKKGDILPFEDELYDRLSKVYFNGYPLSIQIKYLKPKFSPGQCEDRSWFITMGFEDALWVSGDNKDLELNYGKSGAWHFWVEHDGWVYDPTLLYKIKKELYYKMYMCKNVIVRYPSQYKQDEWYQEVVGTTIDDLRPGGKDRCHLCVSIPLLVHAAEHSSFPDFLEEVNKHLKLIEYDHKQISDELNESVSELIRKRT